MLFQDCGRRGKTLSASAALIALIAQGCGADKADVHETGGGGTGGSEPRAGRSGMGGASGAGMPSGAGDSPLSGGAAGDDTLGGASNQGGNAGRGGGQSLGGAAGMGDETAGSAGVGVDLAVSTHTLAFSVVCPGPAIVSAKTFTLSNSGSASLTWSAASAASWLTIAPTSGTLAAGAHTEVTVSPKRWAPTPLSVTELTADIAVASDEPGAAQVIHVSETNGGLSFSVVPPANIDFGLVAVPGMASVSITADPAWVGAALASSNSTDFALNGSVPGSDGKWSLQFKPATLGPHTTTLTLGSTTKCVLSPNTFTATGTGIVN